MSNTTKTKYSKQFKQYITDLSTLFKNTLKLQEYRSQLEFQEEPKYPGEEEGVSVCADVMVDATYLMYHIRVYPDLQDHFDIGSFTDVVDVMLHEHIHVYTAPLKKLVLDMELSDAEEGFAIETDERQVQRVTNCVRDLLPTYVFNPASLKKVVSV